MQLSSIEINNNSPVTTTALTGHQDFRLPTNYPRGTRQPEVTGFSLCQQVDDPTNVTVTVIFEVEVDFAWTRLYSQSIVGTHAAGDFIWTDVIFDDPVVFPDMEIFNYRIIFESNTPTYINRFRLLANTAESDEDWLGNQYRSIAVRSTPDNVDTQSINDKYWYSKPNPSKFAVESLYFDLGGVDGRDSVFDRILLDPITPGVVFHVYYSSEGNPGKSRTEWEDKLWSPVLQTFKATRREEHAMPVPVAARYVKVEFCHLQAQHYSPGTFHGAIQYQKHPKWVLDYFLARMDADNSLISRRVAVVYDAYQLAYDYYLDDLKQAPHDPLDVNNFLSTRTDTSDQVDIDTMNRIATTLAPYQNSPRALGKGLDYLPSLYTTSQVSDNYPVENVVRAKANTVDVSNLNREALLVENNYPAMFFYITSRHNYREVQASFREDRAYFVGIRELAFTRDAYAVAADQEVYVDTLGDFANAFRNDFLLEENRPKLGRVVIGPEYDALLPRTYDDLLSDFPIYNSIA